MSTTEGQGRTSVAGRLGITFLPPLALWLVGERVLLPGVPGDFVKRMGGSHANVGIFALGVAPILSAYWLVELVALVVPRWSRRRHADEAMRASLDRAVYFVTLIVAVLQAAGVFYQVERLATPDLAVSAPLVVAALLGGLAIQFAVARLITRRGLLNGLVVLSGANLLPPLVDTFVRLFGLGDKALLQAPRPHDVDLRAGSIAAIASLVIVVATSAVLRGAGETTARSRQEQVGAPFRGAQVLVLHPTIPVLVGSFQPYLLASSILTIPVIFTFWTGAEGLPDYLYLPAFAVVAALVTTLFAALMFRPSELSNLVERLGAKAGPEFQRDVREGVRRALPLALLFLVTVLLAAKASRLSAVALASLVPIGIDLVHSLRVRWRRGDLVPVWEERRIAAIPLVRATLAEQGIEAEVQGAAVLSFWQVFAPYAPATLLVRPTDAERAKKVIGHLLSGADAPEEGVFEPVRIPEMAWTLRRRAFWLGATGLVACVLFGTSKVPRSATALGEQSRATLAVVRIDDGIDPFAEFEESALPHGEGISLRSETLPGDGGSFSTHYVRLTLRPGENKAAARARLYRWLGSVSLPAGARFGVQPMFEGEERKVAVAFRTYVLVGDSSLSNADVTDALVMDADSDKGEPYLAVTLSPDGAKRFEDMTREWTRRRIALMIDDEITTAPIVRSPIRGGKISLLLGGGSPEERVVEGRELQRRLLGR